MLVLVLGGGVMVVVWAILVAWIAKLAQSSGRIVAGWALGAAATGVLAVAAGLALIVHLVDLETANSLTLLSALTPPVFMVGSMIVLGLVLQRMSIKISHRDEWPVHFVNRGPGRISIDAGVARFVWPDGSRTTPLDQLQRVEADGECVRIGCAEDLELVALPMGKPETPAGRKQQSLTLARRLRVNHAPAASASNP